MANCCYLHTLDAIELDIFYSRLTAQQQTHLFMAVGNLRKYVLRRNYERARAAGDYQPADTDTEHARCMGLCDKPAGLCGDGRVSSQPGCDKEGRPGRPGDGEQHGCESGV